MKRHIHIREEARADVREIARYIAAENARAGQRFLEAAQNAFEFPATVPGAGALRRSHRADLKGLRSWPITRFRNWLVFYLPKSNEIEIVRVIHGMRDIARLLDEY